MHPNDRQQAIKFLRSIASVSIQVAEVLEGTRKADVDETTDLAEGVSLIEGDLEKIEGLNLWSDTLSEQENQILALVALEEELGPIVPGGAQGGIKAKIRKDST